MIRRFFQVTTFAVALTCCLEAPAATKSKKAAAVKRSTPAIKQPEPARLSGGVPVVRAASVVVLVLPLDDPILESKAM